ncbi:MAG: glycosyltransferase family 4 protein [Pyrinomonadaceae bacterium MAG19_C2-C3]|nr:glycosyltransferase family 4 protein [Pyrinomonadaceae bacterium MAG19_C2-C3]
MKIAVWHNLPSGGAKRALFDHVRGLVERKHTVEAWCLDTSDRDYLPLRELVPEHVVPFRWHASKLPTRGGRLVDEYRNSVRHLRAFDEACRQCANEIQAKDFDLLFANGSVLYYMPFVMRHVQIPTVMYLQEPFRPLYEAQPTLPWIAKVGSESNALYKRFGRFMKELPRLQFMRLQAKEEWINAHSCDMILVNTYFSRESVLRAYDYDAKVCYLGVDTSLFQQQHKERERFIVGLGSFDSIKGIDLAIKSIALLTAPRPPLVWISNSGNTVYKDQMLTVAKEANVELQIKMRISDAELVDTLNRASLMLYTSRLEPFGYAPLEANACGTPVVAVAEGGIRETIQDGVNGLLVDREPEAIASAIKSLLSDATLRQSLGENAAQHVRQKWSLKHGIDRLEARLHQALQDSVKSKRSQVVRGEEQK